MALYLPLLGVFLLLLFTNLIHITPRIKYIISKMREEVINEVIKAMPSPTDGFKFTDFTAWHAICHSLERRELRLRTWLKVIIFCTFIGSGLVALIVCLDMFQVKLPGQASVLMRVPIGLSLIIAIVAVIEPCYLIFRHSEPKDSSLSD